MRLISLCFVLQALRLLSEDFVQKHPGLKQQVVLQLLNNSVVLGHNRKVAVEAISVLQGHSEALLSGMIPCSPSAATCHLVVYCANKSSGAGASLHIQTASACWTDSRVGHTLSLPECKY